MRRSREQVCDHPYGTLRAERVCMAAVFCLVMLPAIAAIGFMIKAIAGGDMSLGTAFAGLVFTLLAGGVFIALLGMVKKAEDEPV